MKTNQAYAFLSFVTGVAILGLTVGAITFAQAITPLSCSVGTSIVNPNQATILTASGGNGTYAWSGPNLNINNASGNQFAVSYPNAGTYTITVTSAGLTSSCTFTVASAPTTGAVVCSPGTQNVILGQTATVSASGGNGTYTWSSPVLTIANPTGTGFSANFASTGLKTLTVTSGGTTDTCAVNVLGAPFTPPVTPPVTPGLPNTGYGFGR